MLANRSFNLIRLSRSNKAHRDTPWKITLCTFGMNEGVCKKRKQDLRQCGAGIHIRLPIRETVHILLSPGPKKDAANPALEGVEGDLTYLCRLSAEMLRSERGREGRGLRPSGMGVTASTFVLHRGETSPLTFPLLTSYSGLRPLPGAATRSLRPHWNSVIYLVC